MPIIVDEVVISVEVTNPPASPDGQGAGVAGAAAGLDDKSALVAECVERTLEILRQREER